ncbi:MAG: ATP-binding protein [Planctomycetes bacterium]|nr:ATP-binding protein [Planctomycetota bacterium]
MRHVARDLEPLVRQAAKAFPAVVLTGPRRSGKTHLLRRLLPGASYELFEDPDTIARFQADPRGFLDGLRLPAVLDEVQNIPELFNYVRSRIDAQRSKKPAQWFLTGSQEPSLMEHVTESMAGRAAILELLPFSARETPRGSLLHGGYPEVVADPKHAPLWFRSYVKTYIERDVRSILAVKDLARFQRFLALLATRHGQVLNKSELAAPLGMSIPGIGDWLDVLESTRVVLRVPPYFTNLGKRLIKSPKIYFADPGLACHLLGLEDEGALARSPFRGALFEGLIASEIAKSQVHAGKELALYFFRDHQGLEVDFLVPLPNGGLRMIEAKAAATVFPDDARSMRRLAEARSKSAEACGPMEMFLVHEESKSAPKTRALAPGVEAWPWREFVADQLPQSS